MRYASGISLPPVQKLVATIIYAHSRAQMQIESGERPDRRRGRKKGGERVAAVGEGRSRSVGKDIRRAPQQDTGL